MTTGRINQVAYVGDGVVSSNASRNRRRGTPRFASTNVPRGTEGPAFSVQLSSGFQHASDANLSFAPIVNEMLVSFDRRRNTSR